MPKLIKTFVKLIVKSGAGEYLPIRTTPGGKQELLWQRRLRD